MKPEELMIGDYIEFDGKAIKLTISNFKQLILIHLKEKTQKGLLVKPIPLDEQWLLDFGFEKGECGISAADMWQGMDVWYIKDPYGMKITFRADPDSLVIQLTLYPYWNLRCMYVHTLQNLYFALTGQKLNKK